MSHDVRSCSLRAVDPTLRSPSGYTPRPRRSARRFPPRARIRPALQYQTIPEHHKVIVHAIGYEDRGFDVILNGGEGTARSLGSVRG